MSALATPGQLGLIAGVLGRAGYRGREARLDELEGYLCRPLDTSAELSRAEANRILARLRRAGLLAKRGRARNFPITSAASPTAYLTGG